MFYRRERREGDRTFNAQLPTFRELADSAHFASFVSFCKTSETQVSSFSFQAKGWEGFYIPTQDARRQSGCKTPPTPIPASSSELPWTYFAPFVSFCKTSETQVSSFSFQLSGKRVGGILYPDFLQRFLNREGRRETRRLFRPRTTERVFFCASLCFSWPKGIGSETQPSALLRHLRPSLRQLSYESGCKTPPTKSQASPVRDWTYFASLRALRGLKKLCALRALL